jgi:hypothetical protein
MARRPVRESCGAWNDSGRRGRLGTRRAAEGSEDLQSRGIFQPTSSLTCSCQLLLGIPSQTSNPHSCCKTDTSCSCEPHAHPPRTICPHTGPVLGSLLVGVVAGVVSSNEEEGTGEHWVNEEQEGRPGGVVLRREQVMRVLFEGKTGTIEEEAMVGECLFFLFLLLQDPPVISFFLYP